MVHARTAVLLATVCFSGLASPLACQCALQWQSLNGNNVVDCAMRWDPDGSGPIPARWIVGGSFTSIGGIAANGVAAYDPIAGTWSALGSGVAGTNFGVWALAQMPNGDLVAGGLFASAGGIPTVGMARWNGASWSAMGPASTERITELLVMPNGDLLAAGRFLIPVPPGPSVLTRYLYRWDGANWTTFGHPVGGWVYSLHLRPNGDLVAGGAFTSIGGVAANRIAAWNGTSWSPLASGMSGTQTQVPSVSELRTIPGGDMIAAGDFDLAGGVPANNIARWNGSSWSTLGAGLLSFADIKAVTVLPDGDLLAGGFNTLSRWNGASWTSTPIPFPFLSVAVIEPLSNGALLIAGDLSALGNVATLSSTCLATAVVSGTGCPSSGGSNTLTASSLPWVDSTFQAKATGLPTNAIVVAATSFTSIAQGAAPLSNVFPQAGFGCDLLVNPDILSVLVTTTGTAESSLFLHNIPPLVGISFYHQIVPIELDAQGNWISVTATNALRLTAGAF